MSSVYEQLDLPSKKFELLVHALDDIFDIDDFEMAFQALDLLDRIEVTKEQLIGNRLLECMNDLYADTPNEYLKFRLAPVIQKWSQVLYDDTKNAINSKQDIKQIKSKQSTSVFEAVIRDDDYFFKTTSVPELLHRLLNSFSKDYKVTDMSTVLNTIDTLEAIEISPSQLATTRLVTYVRKLRQHTTNKFLSERLRVLLRKWRDMVHGPKTSPKYPARKFVKAKSY